MSVTLDPTTGNPIGDSQREVYHQDTEAEQARLKRKQTTPGQAPLDSATGTPEVHLENGVPVTNTFAVTYNTAEAPPLPDVELKASTSHATTHRKMHLAGRSVSLADILAAIDDPTGPLTKLRLKIAADISSYSEEQQSIDASIEKIKGERTSAITLFVSSLLGTAFAGGLSAAGVKLNWAPKGPTEGAWGAALTASGGAIGGLFNQTGNLVDKLALGKKKADDQEVNRLVHEYFKGLSKSVADALSGSYQTQIEHQRKLNEMVKDYFQKDFDFVSRLFR
jgi:hypothetical protein